MQQTACFLLALVASVAAQPAFLPTAAAPVAGYNPYPGLAGAPPLSVSSSERLDYFNQFNAAFAPSGAARVVATPTGLAALQNIFGFPAVSRFGQPARLLTATPATVSAPIAAAAADQFFF